MGHPVGEIQDTRGCGPIAPTHTQGRRRRGGGGSAGSGLLHFENRGDDPQKFEYFSIFS